MNAAAVLIILLSNQGCWFGGSPNQISVGWVARAEAPAATLRWELRFGNEKVASGETPMLADPQKTVIRISPPEVRVRTAMRWKYALTTRDGGRELAHGEMPVEVFPDSLMDGLAKRIGKSQVVVMEETGDLAKALDRCKAPYRRVADPSKIAFAQPDAVLVGTDAIDPSPFTQGPLLDLANAGASVLIFRQARPSSLASYRIVPRDAPAKFDWLLDHPLLRGFDTGILQGIGTSTTNWLAVRLPPDEPVLAIAAWPREMPGDNPVAIDALLVTKTVGKGRIVLCQVPLEDWAQDPRSQMFLVNAIDYLLSPPEPTSRPSERPTTRPAEPRTLPTITIPPGDRP